MAARGAPTRARTRGRTALATRSQHAKGHIDRVLKKAARARSTRSAEGYGGGTALIVEAMTDKNRTASEVRAAFGKRVAGETGSVSFMTDRVGRSSRPKPPTPTPCSRRR